MVLSLPDHNAGTYSYMFTIVMTPYRTIMILLLNIQKSCQSWNTENWSVFTCWHVYFNYGTTL